MASRPPRQVPQPYSQPISFNSKLRDEFLNGGDLLLDQGTACAGRALARSLQHRQTTHFVGYKPPAPEAWLTNSKGHGEVETATRFPLLTPDGGYLNSEVNALH
jgi:putative transposase